MKSLLRRLLKLPADCYSDVNSEPLGCSSNIGSDNNSLSDNNSCGFSATIQRDEGESGRIKNEDVQSEQRHIESEQQEVQTGPLIR